MKSPPWIEPLHTVLGWMLTVMLTLTGGMLLLTAPLIAISHFSLAILLCPKTPIPAWAKLLLALVGLFTL